jgi:hypothetical protein
MDVDQAKIQEAVKAAAQDGKIACGDARGIAERLQISYQTVGEVADDLKIKISSCELGCF